jgi:nucleotide-binding universal stress UspA family protein
MILAVNFKDITKILIPTDGSDSSMRAAEYGINVAKMLDAQIMVVYVIDSVVLDEARPVFKVGEREDVELKLKQAGQRYINYVLGLAEKQGVKAASSISKGRPFDVIVHLAEDSNVNLLVMGTHGRRGSNRILIGNVAERVIEYSPCPVLVVK